MTATYINPTELPPEHELRNRTLGDVRAEYRNLQTKVWRSVYRPDGAIPMPVSLKPYNALSGPWIECNEWRIPTT